MFPFVAGGSPGFPVGLEEEIRSERDHILTKISTAFCDRFKKKLIVQTHLNSGEKHN